MRCFRTTSYKLYKNELSKNLKIFVMSDIHFSYAVSDEKLDYILAEIAKENPHYVFLVGDLIDSSEVLIDKCERKRLISWIEKLSSITKLMITLGNHDSYGINPINNEWIRKYDSLFFEEIDKMDNVHVLNNLSYEDEWIYVTGFHASHEYYHPIRGGSERRETLLEELEDSIPSSMPSDKIKFFLFHSPIWLTDKEVSKALEEYDYFISGHMHNGCVPPVLDELWPSDRGLISPSKHLFEHNARNTLIDSTDKLIVSGAVTTFHACSKGMRIFNILFPIYNSIIEFTNHKEYERKKIYVKKEYHK